MAKKLKALLSAIAVVAMVASSATIIQAADDGQVDITILETSDLHGVIYPYDYAADTALNGGLAKVATIVKQEREKDPNLLLVDCGDTLQGNMISDFRENDVHPMFEAMNLLKFDAFALGNHEFNFEWDNLVKALKSFDGEVLSANIYKKNGERYAKPYMIKEIEGVKVGIFGLVAPHVTTWEASDPTHFDNMTFTTPMEETGKVLDELEDKADVIIGLAHYGLNGEYGTEGMREVVEAYADRIDGMLIGHAHQVIDEEIAGVPVLEPGSNGSNVAKLTLTVEKVDGKWEVVNHAMEMLSTKEVEPDAEMLEAMKYVDDESKAKANEVVGQVSADFFEDTYVLPNLPRVYVEDNALIDLINKVQMEYAGADVSLAATFGDNLNLMKGDFKYKDGVKVYKYDNFLIGVKVNGATLKQIMEKQAGTFFNQFKPGDVTVSFKEGVANYMYDAFAGVDYEINISKPEGQRIENVMYKGAPLADDQELVLAVNNYRYGNLMSAGFVTDDDKVFDSNNEILSTIRDMVIDYVTKKGTIDPECDHNWKITGLVEYPEAEEVYEKVRKGEIEIERGNRKSLNIFELRDAGLISGNQTQEPTTPVEPSEPTEEEKEPEAEEGTYTVVAGDCLWNIALKYNTTYEAIAKANNIAAPYLIYPGDVLVIR